MNMRLEQRTDYKEVEHLVRESFWNIYRPGCTDHFIVHNLRHHPSYIKDLGYLIEEDDKIIAYIAYSLGGIYIGGEKIIDALNLGPVCVHPEYQKQGYGKKIIEFTLEKAKQMNFPFVIVIGDENYYCRFGFEFATNYDIHYSGVEKEDESPFFMIKVFDKDKVDAIAGIFTESEVFNINEEEFEEFDSKFPPKKKEIREGQLDF